MRNGRYSNSTLPPATRNPRGAPPASGNSNVRTILVLLFFATVCVCAGFAIGWWAKDLLQPSSTTLTSNLEIADTDQIQCPETEDKEMALQVFDQAVTGEGVIEFTFYSPDNSSSTHKWVSRIPLPDISGLRGSQAIPQAISAATSEKEKIVPVKEAQKTSAKPTPESHKQQPQKRTTTAVPTKKTSKKVTKDAIEDVLARHKSDDTNRRGKFTVQISAHRDRKQAERQVSSLESHGLDARVEKAVVPGKGIWYRVRLGKNLTKSEATAIRKKVAKALDLEPSIIIP